ncbi:hypothetical protein LPJ66_002797 [Kickxella alabastrina]|uniref:Uncharacterized protein n=1 Tax=Kickxella alabastrina TaxID=61397 RepID=A0ACC1IPH0_9FUNG|nr:hypothetical protein LPJ66_002797 [Kickxella alabastrina]
MAFSLLTRRTLGLTLLLCVVFIWVGSSFLVSNLFGKQQFNRPFFITYINTGTFSFYLIGTYISHIRKQRRQPGQRKRSRSDDNIIVVSNNSGEGSPLVIGGAESEGMPTAAAAAAEAEAYPIHPRNEKLTVRETVLLGVSFCILWFAANITQNASLAYTSVANSSILCSTSGLFTLIIGALGGIERFTGTRLIAVFISTLGVYSIVKYGVSTADSATMPLSWLGDSLALLSAVLYGCYTTLLKLRIGSEERLDTPLFFGAVGLANIVLLWPGFIVLHYSGMERFQLPGSVGVWGMILVNALVGTFLSDFLWLKAMLMTSPLVVTLGLSLTIPLSMAGDIVFKGMEASVPYYLGALLILSAFIAANL